MAQQSTGRPALACARERQIVSGCRALARVGQLLRAAIPFGALCAFGQLSCASVALAEPELDLSWSAPDTCPDAAWARRRIAAQLAREPAADVAQGVRANVSVQARASGYELVLHTAVAGASGERTIQAQACEELAQAAALIIALSVSEASEQRAPPNPPAPPSAAARPPAPAPAAAAREARETLFALRADLVLDLGFFDRLGIGPALAVAYQYGVWRAELAALWLAPQTVEADDPAAGSVETSLWALRAGGCALFGSFRLQGGPCIGAEFGRARAEGGQGLQRPAQQKPRWIAGFLGGRLSVGLIAKLALVVEADLSVLAEGPSFVTAAADGSGENLPIHKPTPAQLRASAGIELRF